MFKSLNSLYQFFLSFFAVESEEYLWKSSESAVILDKRLMDLSVEQWTDKFKPIQNHINSKAIYFGRLFKIFGQEANFVKSHSYRQVWSLLHFNDGRMQIVNGFHTLNAAGYFVTELPWVQNTDYNITVYIPGEYPSTIDVSLDA